MDRRDFIKITGTLTGFSLLAEACQVKAKNPTGATIGASHHIGHLLRDKKFDQHSESKIVEVVIVGGGISGLNAARHLAKNGVKNLVVIDLEKEVGGNARCGENKISKFPWGAHYIPLPNNDLKEYLEFLEEIEVIVAWSAEGLPIYNEFYLCHDPEERLYINGMWQEGLVPKFGLNKSEEQQIQAFLSFVQQCRYALGEDGKPAFAIPVDDSSADMSFRKWDTISMKDFLLDNSWDSPALHWYVNYCTRDDFGTNYDEVSAWFGIHYFAARKGKAANAHYADVLTWEEGNGFLANHLKKDLHILNNALVSSVELKENGVVINYYDVQTHQVHCIIAQHCILATPQFVSARLLQDSLRQNDVRNNFKYAPWLVANLTVRALEERSGMAPCWDNVIYGSPALGYVDATHQQTQQHKSKRVLTYYWPLTHLAVDEARKEALSLKHEDWVPRILKDSQKVHPNIIQATENIDIMIWGHAMAQPLKGTLENKSRKALAKSIENRIHFAHTDLAGISIFEEAFYQGLNAAKKVLSNIKVDAQ